jgi:hypothetical protein
MVFNATFNNISIISWRSVLLENGNQDTVKQEVDYTTKKSLAISDYTTPVEKIVKSSSPVERIVTSSSPVERIVTSSSPVERIVTAPVQKIVTSSEPVERIVTAHLSTGACVLMTCCVTCGSATTV